MGAERRVQQQRAKCDDRLSSTSTYYVLDPYEFMYPGGRLLLFGYPNNTVTYEYQHGLRVV
eukprot:scaffold510853_cov20-Prasinocladus_malaysianus.AAC.1